MPDKISSSAIANGAVTTTQLSQAVNDKTNTIYTQANTKASIGLVIALS